MSFLYGMDGAQVIAVIPVPSCAVQWPLSPS